MTLEKPERIAAHAHRRRLAVVLVHDHRDVRIGLDGRLDEVAQEMLAGVLARAGRALHDHRAAGLVGGLHDGADLFQVVHVEGGQAVAVFRGVVQQLAHRYEGHGGLLKGGSEFSQAAASGRVAVLADAHDLHGVGAARRADRLADGQHDGVARLRRHPTR
jgi:hypothetical protein